MGAGAKRRPGRRTWTIAVRARIIAEINSLDAIVNVVARRHGINPSQLSQRRREWQADLVASDASAGLYKLDPNDVRERATHADPATTLDQSTAYLRSPSEREPKFQNTFRVETILPSNQFPYPVRVFRHRGSILLRPKSFSQKHFH